MKPDRPGWYWYKVKKDWPWQPVGVSEEPQILDDADGPKPSLVAAIGWEEELVDEMTGIWGPRIEGPDCENAEDARVEIPDKVDPNYVCTITRVKPKIANVEPDVLSCQIHTANQPQPPMNRLALVLLKNQLPRYGHISQPNEHGFRVMPDAQSVRFHKSSTEDILIDRANSDAAFGPPVETVIAQDEIRMILYAPPTAEEMGYGG